MHKRKLSYVSVKVNSLINFVIPSKTYGHTIVKVQLHFFIVKMVFILIDMPSSLQIQNNNMVIYGIFSNFEFYKTKLVLYYGIP